MLNSLCALGIELKYLGMVMSCGVPAFSGAAFLVKGWRLVLTHISILTCHYFDRLFFGLAVFSHAKGRIFLFAIFQLHFNVYFCFYFCFFFFQFFNKSNIFNL